MYNSDVINSADFDRIADIWDMDNPSNPLFNKRICNYDLELPGEVSCRHPGVDCQHCIVKQTWDEYCNTSHE